MAGKNMQRDKPSPFLIGYNFSPERAREARDKGKLLTMRTETSLMCNLACRYCNGTSGTPPPGEISFETIKDVITQARDLGAESVVVIGGGEPTIYPSFRDLIAFIHDLKIITVIFTNTMTMTKDLAKYLFDTNCSVITKLDSLNENRQDFLAGKKGSYKKIQKGITNLINAGFTNGDSHKLRLAASFVTTSLTLDETPDIWRFCRDNKIYPNQELLVPRGRALTGLSHLTPTIDQIHALKKELLHIDEEEYGYSWLVHAPLTGQGCLQHMYSIYLTSIGYIRPCADVDIKMFNVKDMTIKQIIQSDFFNTARHIEEHLKGKCKGCNHLDECIGCRGLSFSTGINEGLDVYEAISREDPLCTHKVKANKVISQ
jgi:radical SAM protein with 4Fe4S-binding SPASM domain